MVMANESAKSHKMAQRFRKLCNTSTMTTALLRQGHQGRMWT